MFNPLYPFTKDVLETTVARGCYYFVRNNYPPAFDHFQDHIKGYFLFTHYNDLSKAEAHFNSITQDPYRKLYNWEVAADQEKLRIAANHPEGYKIFSAYFLPDYKKLVTANIKQKINQYIFRYTNWKPGRGETVHIDFFLQFGALYISLGFAGQQLKITFEEIEKQS
jgi:hypothetical protein